MVTWRPTKQDLARSAGVSPNSTRASSVRPAPTRPARPRISPARTLSVTPVDAGAAQPTSSRREHDVAKRHVDLRERRRRARGRPSGGSAPAGRRRRIAGCRRTRRRAARSRGRRSAAAPPAGARCRSSRRRAPASSRMTRKRFVDLAVRQRRGRLVEDQDLGVGPKAAGDLDELLLRHREVADEGVRRDVGPDAVEQLRRPAGAARPSGGTATARRAPGGGRCSRRRSGRGTGPAAGRWRRRRATARARVQAIDGLPDDLDRAGVRRWAPVITLISVDLPAPFSPTSAWTSPGSSSNETPLSACTPPKDLVMSESLRTVFKISPGRQL